ncbi:MAG: penicillin-insensitive murein endopeptidase [Mesorhizobium sp.]
MKMLKRSICATAARLLAGLMAVAAVAGAGPAGAEQLAKNLFGTQQLPAATPPRSIGFYSKGCFSGGVALPLTGPTWEVMRPSRNRNWGHPALIALLEQFSRDAAADGWPGLLIGDISQPRGGPMRTGHASHQIGLDVDIWFQPMPPQPYSLTEREKVPFVSMLKPRSLTVDDRRWTPAHTLVLKRAASYPQVERILVHPGIKKRLCDTVVGDRSWLRKIRPFWGHDEHFHIRIGCQPGSPDCKKQAAVPAGEGCDKSLAWWFTDEPWRPNENPDAPKARDLMTMASLPKECRAVLAAPAPASMEAATYRGGSAVAAAAPAPSPGPSPAPAASIPAIIGETQAAPVTASAFAPTPAIGVPLPRPRPGN